MSETITIHHGHPISSQMKVRLGEAFTRMALHSDDVIAAHIQNFYDQQESDWYHLGCPDNRDFEALVYIVTAADLLNSMRHDDAVRILQLAIDQIGRTNH